LIVDMATAPGLRSPHVSIRAQTAPTVVHLTRNLSPPIGAQRLRGPGAVLRELVGNSVPLPGNPSERDPEGCQNSDPGLNVGFDTLQGSGQSSWAALEVRAIGAGRGISPSPVRKPSRQLL